MATIGSKVLLRISSALIIDDIHGLEGEQRNVLQTAALKKSGCSQPDLEQARGISGNFP
ncbi:MAG: hypothetical protein E6559_12595 [Pantoea sp.]|uniref:hypothetical protein n=1 Tax=Pantoea septica TaxID=472695 RepID=UPI001C0F9DBA|nr:hypothetical protein [Pantoea septica]MBU5379135.1 hypothetical protein [Pantoea septica]MDU5836210.1 hypothetical protein [Pantoea sp.]MDU6440730.1 hypothetical protein [Pantoea sp.]